MVLSSGVMVSKALFLKPLVDLGLGLRGSVVSINIPEPHEPQPLNIFIIFCGGGGVFTTTCNL